MRGVLKISSFLINVLFHCVIIKLKLGLSAILEIKILKLKYDRLSLMSNKCLLEV